VGAGLGDFPRPKDLDVGTHVPVRPQNPLPFFVMR